MLQREPVAEAERAAARPRPRARLARRGRAAAAEAQLAPRLRARAAARGRRQVRRQDEGGGDRVQARPPHHAAHRHGRRHDLGGARQAAGLRQAARRQGRPGLRPHVRGRPARDHDRARLRRARQRRARDGADHPGPHARSAASRRTPRRPHALRKAAGRPASTTRGMWFVKENVGTSADKPVHAVVRVITPEAETLARRLGRARRGARGDGPGRRLRVRRPRPLRHRPRLRPQLPLHRRLGQAARLGQDRHRGVHGRREAPGGPQDLRRDHGSGSPSSRSCGPPA